MSIGQQGPMGHLGRVLKAPGGPEAQPRWVYNAMEWLEAVLQRPPPRVERSKLPVTIHCNFKLAGTLTAAFECWLLVEKFGLANLAGQMWLHQCIQEILKLIVVQYINFKRCYELFLTRLYRSVVGIV